MQNPQTLLGIGRRPAPSLLLRQRGAALQPSRARCAAQPRCLFGASELRRPRGGLAAVPPPQPGRAAQAAPSVAVSVTRNEQPAEVTITDLEKENDRELMRTVG